MNIISQLKELINTQVVKLSPSQQLPAGIEYKINSDTASAFGDISCNAAMILAKQLGQNPRMVATTLQQSLQEADSEGLITAMAIAGPGFLNISLSPKAWQTLWQELYQQQAAFFVSKPHTPAKFLLEFVSANPTGPLHLGHGRGGIIGDTLAKVLTFQGHTVLKEFYINDAGNQVKLLGLSLKARCLQQLGHVATVPEDGYAGEYLIDLAADCVAQHGPDVAGKDDMFFQLYAKEQLLGQIKATLTTYGITFDNWFSEKTLHDNGAIDEVLTLLQEKGLAYELDGALWFKSTAFGDDKDRVIKKSTGELTYIAADIAYHKNKFDRGYTTLIDILGHDHHGYVRRLKATMEALGYRQDQLDVVLYQLVNIKENDVAVKMSKRAGTFTKLSDVIEAVGTDVARFFYLNRKADVTLDFDLAAALKKTDENPVYYIQYAYVRLVSLMQKAAQEGLGDTVNALRSRTLDAAWFNGHGALLSEHEIALLKKIVMLQDVLQTIATSYQTHLLSYYALELAQQLHNYYTHNKVLDKEHTKTTAMRLAMVFLVHQTLGLCLDLLGLTKPEKM